MKSMLIVQGKASRFLNQSRLISLTVSILLHTENQYNLDGIRHAQSDGTNTKAYFVDANRNYAQVLAEVVNGSTSVSYHHGDDLIRQDRNNATHYFHVDGLGSTRVLTVDTGNSTDAYDYAASIERMAYMVFLV